MINPTIILILPLLSTLVILFYGRKLGIQGAACVSLTNIILVIIITLNTFYKMIKNEDYIYVEYTNWINVGMLNISWGFLFDTLTMLMIIVITFISLLVHFYSYEYMNNDPYIVRFFAYLSMFTFFMLILVSANNWLLLFLGWEGVGICSYLLIGFWNTRILANKSAIKALIVNRVGDVCLVIGISIIFFFLKH